MLTAVGLTLIFAAMTCALGFEKYVGLYLRTRDRRYFVGIWAQAVMAVWQWVAGVWVLVRVWGELVRARLAPPPEKSCGFFDLPTEGEV
jgi:hypothetical protein